MNIIEQLPLTFDSELLLKEYQSLVRVIGYKSAQYPARHETTVVYKQDFLPETEDLCPYLKTTCDVLTDHNIDFNYVAFRLMPPRSTLNFHLDLYVSKNYHIPIQTNDGCFFVWANRLLNMQNVGHLYKVDSSRIHTFINAGDSNRIHIQFAFDTNRHLLNGQYL